MEVTVKLRLLLASTLFLFAQMPTMQAQESLDLAKITCERFQMRKLNTPSRDIVEVSEVVVSGVVVVSEERALPLRLEEVAEFLASNNVGSRAFVVG
jgi:hypothetical protein